MAETITVDMVIHDVVTKYPATVKVFHGHGLTLHRLCSWGRVECLGRSTHASFFSRQAHLC